MNMPSEYREFFVAVAGATGALIGLLVVAVSVFPEGGRQSTTRTEYHARASAALIVFSNALLMSLAALVPGVSLGWWAVVTGVTLLVFVVATARAVISAARHGRGKWKSLRLVFALLLVAGFELYAGIRLVHDESDLQAVRTLDYVAIACLGIGIARSWQLMHMRDIGLFSMLFTLTRSVDDEPPDAADKTVDQDSSGGR